ncbi:hypothetical protein BIFADO_00154 [Bifidobacterium adolescentis L2-32]|uniref:Uncharacterized protein n=1 Tax=Bifidobacterium adolescentis L2-32 TaxID=411481 RepID=A7A2X0_BIFAD|nr:hypothetical protein BIFADO_00154 [Bifidobacterium adolescentis L2-32]
MGNSAESQRLCGLFYAGNPHENVKKNGRRDNLFRGQSNLVELDS